MSKSFSNFTDFLYKVWLECVTFGSQEWNAEVLLVIQQENANESILGTGFGVFIILWFQLTS